MVAVYLFVVLDDDDGEQRWTMGVPIRNLCDGLLSPLIQICVGIPWKSFSNQ